MIIINQSHEILEMPKNLKFLEIAGRICYQSSKKITDNSSEKFIKMLVDSGHHAIIEFQDIIVKFITNRGVTHELVRHRLCSFAQESTRYVKYNNVVFIKPVWYDNSTQEQKNIWEASMREAEKNYRMLIEEGWKAQKAREVLPNSLKTEIVVKANIREWMHILKLRTAKNAHPQIRELMINLLKELQKNIFYVFDDILENN